jgi:2-methylisocitrate lyase-like PEP mutase family enzyme
MEPRTRILDRTTFLDLLDTHPIIAAPGAYDAFSARIIEQADFPVVYFTGLGNEASDLGFPDIGLTTATEMARRIGNVSQCVNVETAGVAAIHLEDQTFPKRCGLLAGKQVISSQDFARVIETALAARRGDDFSIIARSDAKATDGVDGVIARLQRYADHGAHAAMLGDFYTLAEYERIAAALPIPLLACAADRDHFDQQPDYSLDEWRNAGVRMVLYWHLPLFAALQGVRDAVTSLKNRGSTSGLEDRVAGYDDYAEVTDLEKWLELEN